MDHVFRNLVAVKVCLGQLVGEHGCCIKHKLPLLLCFVLKLCRDIFLNNIKTVVAAEVDSLHLHQVHYTLQLVLKSDRNLHEHRVKAQLVVELLLYLVWVCTGSVALVHKCKAWNLITLKLPVYSDGLGLDTSYRTEHQDSSIQYSEGTLNLYCEVYVARGVDYIDGSPLPYNIGCSRCNGNSSLSLKLHGVHGCSHAVFSVNLVDCMYLVAIEKDTLRKSSLAGIDMRTDTDVS